MTSSAEVGDIVLDIRLGLLFSSAAVVDTARRKLVTSSEEVGDIVLVIRLPLFNSATVGDIVLAIRLPLLFSSATVGDIVLDIRLPCGNSQKDPLVSVTEQLFCLEKGL